MRVRRLAVLALVVFLSGCLGTNYNLIEKTPLILTVTKPMEAIASSPTPFSYPYPEMTPLPPKYPDEERPLQTATPITPISTCESHNLVMDAEFDTAVALHILYGDLGCVYGEVEEVQIIENGRQTGILKPLIVTYYEEQGVKKVMFLIQSRMYDGNSVDIGGAIFIQKDNKWIVSAQNNNILGEGSPRYAPTAELAMLGEDKYGALLHSHSASTGGSSSSTLVIAEINGALKSMGSFLTGKANTNMYPWGYTSTLTFLPADSLVFDDIQLMMTGTKYISNTIQSFQETLVYTVEDNRYVLRD